MFLAGTDTTANTLVFATWYILKNPEIERKLVAELRHAMPNKNAMVKWETLETLPFLVGPVCVLRSHFFN